MKNSGPIVDTHLPQLKCCADGFAKAGDLHAAALIHSLHSHLCHVYGDTGYLSASANTRTLTAINTANIDAGADEVVAVLALEKKVGDPTLGNLLRKIDLSARAERPYHTLEIDRKFEAAGIKGQQAIQAKLRLRAAGLLAA